MTAPLSSLRLAITGMSCAGCVAAVETALRTTSGVVNAEVNFADRTAQVSGPCRSSRPDSRSAGSGL
jgi:Cu+-exporting ATPase